MKFKQIKDFPRYTISDCGTVIINLLTNRRLTLKLRNGDIYIKTTLYSEQGRTDVTVHRIQAYTWHELPKGVKFKDAIVNHKNHIKTDNHKDNLEFTCRKNNAKAHHKHKKNKTVSINKQILIGVSENNLKKS